MCTASGDSYPKLFVKFLLKIKFNSTSEIYAILFVFALLAFLNNVLMYLKVIESLNDSQQNMKNAIRPLIVLIVVLIIYFTG